jgi:ribosome recycling factor
MIYGSTVNVGLVDSIRVEYYGQKTPISHLGSSSSDRDCINVHVYDPDIVSVIVKQLQHEGLSAYAAKTIVRITIPVATEETRDKNKKRVKQLGEDAKVAMRQIRQDLRKKIPKDIAKDDQTSLDKEIQKQLDSWSLMVDKHIVIKLDYL